MPQPQLNKYFSTFWQSNFDRYIYSGWALVDKIVPGEAVLDVGCGFNEFKNSIVNLIGIDPANDQADIKVPIEEYKSTNKFDVAFCLGSINFGNEETILNQINCVVDCLKPNARIYWRCNPGLADHNNKECNNIDFYPWTIAKHAEFAEKFGFRVNVARWDTHNRIYAEWCRQSNT
jgi:hypothetical protein